MKQCDESILRFRILPKEIFSSDSVPFCQQKTEQLKKKRTSNGETTFIEIIP